MFVTEVTTEDVVELLVEEEVVIDVVSEEVLLEGGVDEVVELEVVTGRVVVVLLLIDRATPPAAAITMITMTTTTITALETAAVLRLIENRTLWVFYLRLGKFPRSTIHEKIFCGLSSVIFLKIAGGIFSILKSCFTFVRM